jgi:hypothetical protein
MSKPRKTWVQIRQGTFNLKMDSSRSVGVHTPTVYLYKTLLE